MEYAIDAFELSIFRYVPKNDLEKRLKTAVADAAKLIELEEGKGYVIQAAGRMEKIPYKDIFYIRRDGGKNSAIYSNAGTSKVRKSLQQVYGELAAPEFIFIDRGCIVNIIQIMKVADGMAFLKNGETLPVSRSHVQAGFTLSVTGRLKAISGTTRENIIHSGNRFSKPTDFIRLTFGHYSFTIYLAIQSIWSK